MTNSIQPVVLGEGKPAQHSAILFRWASTNDLKKLADGIHLPNEHMKVTYGSGDQPSTYFSSLGQGTVVGRYIAPYGDEGTVAFNWPAFKPEDQFKHLTAKDETRYGVAILLRLTEDNFSIFEGKVGEIEKSFEIADVKKEISGIDGFKPDAEVALETASLSSQQLAELASDLKVVVYDRENPLKPLEFKTWAEMSRELQEDREIKKELSSPESGFLK